VSAQSPHNAPMSENIEIRLRVPPDLREAIEATAAKNERSINRECIHRLRRSLDQDQPKYRNVCILCGGHDGNLLDGCRPCGGIMHRERVPKGA